MNKFSPRTAVLSAHESKPAATLEVALFFAASMLIMVLLPLKLHADPAEALPGSWQMVWSDEFKQPDGSKPDPTKWGYDTGGSGYGNNEREYYTARTNNVRIED